ncbi:unnamed protein product [Sphagnum jensenii]|uniref:Uncharacterized protein n=1 Tax=Sphagnum jensenii TaxID=128206 RepID=A0ABP1BBW5_9BRYO
MHIVNSIPKDTPGMDGNRVEFYKYCAASPLTSVADAFQRVYNCFINMLAQGAWLEAIGLYFNCGWAILLIKEAS